MLNQKREGVFEILAAVLVLLTNFFDPRVAGALAITLLVLYGIYRMTQQNNSAPATKKEPEKEAK